MNDTNIMDVDVLFGRGGATNNHIGNRQFRILVAQHQQEYLEAKKKEKASISKRIVGQVRQQGGRFLRKDESGSLWVDVGDKKASEKTSQALREGLDVRRAAARSYCAQTTGKSSSSRARRLPPMTTTLATDIISRNNKRKRINNDCDYLEQLRTICGVTTATDDEQPAIMPDLEEEIIPKMMPSFIFQNYDPSIVDMKNLVEV
mmetsp:Transcript_127/g.176  ORF Transcript_127/g.176 Transcript_127/m.176 type:complete len:204 (+) Transcript_127:43-654(+)